MTETRVALITAGGSGLGAGAARQLAADGFKVGVLSPSGRGEALGEELGGFGVSGSNMVEADLARLVEGATDRWGRVDVLVNSAGHGPKGDLLDISDADWQLGMDYYLMSVIRAVRLVTPLMLAQGGGSIINISSFAAFEPDPLFPTSAVFRAGLASFAKLYADRYAADGIRMNNVLPGFVDSLPEKEDRRARIPMGRYGRVKEVASLIGWLASPQGGYMTGQNLHVDGGLTRSV